MCGLFKWNWMMIPTSIYWCQCWESEEGFQRHRGEYSCPPHASCSSWGRSRSRSFIRAIIMIFLTKMWSSQATLCSRIQGCGEGSDQLASGCPRSLQRYQRCSWKWWHNQEGGIDVRNTKKWQDLFSHFQDIGHLWDFAVLVLRHLVWPENVSLSTCPFTNSESLYTRIVHHPRDN